MSNAVYALSADPITYGHINIIERASKIFDEVYVAIGDNPSKKYLFSKNERVYMARVSLSHLDNINIVGFDGLLVDFAHTNNIDVIIRGIRDSGDMDFENNLYLVNESQELDIETICLFTKPQLRKISSSNVKAIQKENGLTSEYVPLVVKDKLEWVIGDKKLIGVTGIMGSGKSFVGESLENYSKDKEYEIHNIDLDSIAKDILYISQQPNHIKVRDKLFKEFNTLETSKIAKIIFKNTDKLEFINKLVYTPLMVELRKITKNLKGIILINSAILIESNMLDYVNNNIIIVESNDNFRFNNLLEHRGIKKSDAKKRIRNVFTSEEKENEYAKNKLKNGYGTLLKIKNNEDLIDNIDEIYNDIIDNFVNSI